MGAIGVSNGALIFLVAAVGAVLLFLLAIRLVLPIYVVIFNTAFLGAAAFVTGIMLNTNQIDRADLGYGMSWTMIQESWLWLVVWIVVASVGAGVQLQSVTSVRLPEERWRTAQAV
jgi:uncharacterized membrane protein